MSLIQLISANGGNGGSGAAAGTGGAIRLEANRIYNHGLLQARAGNGVKVDGNFQQRGSSGGRIAYIANGQVKVGQTGVTGEWLSNEGAIFVGGSYLDTTINASDATITFNTETGYFSIEGVLMGLELLNRKTTWIHLERIGSIKPAVSHLVKFAYPHPVR